VAALNRVTTGTLDAFTPELNEIDVAERRKWPLPDQLTGASAGELTVF
jgi:hypothetical protein